uniref:Small ribosomal subunit protein uS9c n=1 Tax=Pandorina morum TaxID=33099 RepID=A0A6C0RWD6_PANMO|nr:ribosomal protein S9 [Pandorina morum]
MDILAKAVGRRKEAVAQVQLKLGTGQFIINNKPAHEYLQNDFYSLLCVKAPFENILLPTKQTHFKKNEVPAAAQQQEADNLDLTSDSILENIEPNVQTELLKKASQQDLNDENCLNLDTIVIVKGGGLRGQTEAIRLGISRALCSLSTNTTDEQISEVLNFSNVSEIKKQLKDKGYLTQDSRVKERRKYGLKKARKASQYHKR